MSYVDYDELKDYESTLAKYEDELKELIVRIAGVTIEELKESLSIEYEMCEENIMKYRSIIQSIKEQQAQDEKMTACISQYSACTIHDALIGQIDLNGWCDKNRMRYITTLTQRRELAMVMKDLNCYMDIIDYFDNICDTIGSTEVNGMPNKRVTVRVAMFSTVDDKSNYVKYDVTRATTLHSDINPDKT